MLPIKLVVKAFQILSSNVSPRQIAGGFVLGSFLGLAPLLCGHNLLVIALLILINVNIPGAMLGWAVFKVLGLAIDPLSDGLGYLLLVKAGFLHGFWTMLYNLPPFATSGFNNTVVLGGGLISLLLAFPLYKAMMAFVPYYRLQLHHRVQSWRVVKMLKMSKLFTVYQRYHQ